jgi:hypothetical protein
MLSACWLGSAYARKHHHADAPQEELSTAAPDGGPFDHFTDNTWVSRSVSIADVGISKNFTLGDAKTIREIYFPVPANLPLADAAFHFHSSYTRADGGRTTLTLLQDNLPLSAIRVSENKGDTSASFALAADPVSSGFIHFGISWETVLAASANDSACTDLHSRANLLRVEPDSHLSYKFDASQISDLSTAWSALPQHSVLWVAGAPLDAQSYETAWRVAMTMERAGKRVSIQIIPGVGQNVTAVNVPAELRDLPVFNAFVDGSTHVLKDQAELGAWLVLSQIGSQHADVLVSNSAMTSQLNGALDALMQQIAQNAPDASTGFTRLRKLRFTPLTRTLASNELALVVSAGGATILVAGDAGIKFAGMFDTPWRNIAASKTLIVNQIETPRAEADEVLLKSLGASPGGFDVSASGEWQADFEIGAAALKGHRPVELVMDLAAAPNTTGATPVASIFLNDVLLASSPMQGHGDRERMRATIPSYALGAHNLLRVVFVRQLSSDNCRETPGAFPVSVLASSHLILGDVIGDKNFVAMASHLAQGGSVLLPANYLSQAVHTLPRAIRVSLASNVSPVKTHLRFVDNANAVPDTSFLAMDLDFSGEKKHVKVENGTLYLADNKDRKLLDVRGLTRVAVVSVERIGGQAGIVYHVLADDYRDDSQAFQLMRGDMAIIGDQGLLAQYDGQSDADMDIINETREPWYRRHAWWLTPVILALAFIALLYAASVYRRRKTH